MSTGASMSTGLEKHFEHVGCQSLVYKCLFDSLRAHVYKRGQVPCQMSFSNPDSFLKNLDDLNQAREFVEQIGLKAFVHSNVCFNPSNPMPRDLKAVKVDLDVGLRCGFGGVVIHVGKHCNKDTPETALSKMKETILEIVEYGSAECPVLLETPAGQGTELCTTFEEFSKVYDELKCNQLKVCIDTQHVFGSGYEPLNYIQSWVEKHGLESLRLVHFNDSSVIKGSHLDRHARPGSGHIGTQKMIDIAEWCSENGIPAVVE